MFAKNISLSSFKVSTFHAIESEIALSQEFWKKRNSSTPYCSLCIQIASLLFKMIHILHLNFRAISFGRKLQLMPKIPEKVLQQSHLLSDFRQKLIGINLCQDSTKYKISLYSIDYFCRLATLASKFLSLTHKEKHTDRRTFFQKQ